MGGEEAGGHLLEGSGASQTGGLLHSGWQAEGKNETLLPYQQLCVEQTVCNAEGIQSTGKIPLGRIKQIFFEEVNIKTGPTPAVIRYSSRALFFFLTFLYGKFQS